MAQQKVTKLQALRLINENHTNTKTLAEEFTQEKTVPPHAET